MLKDILEFEYITTDEHKLKYKTQITSLLNGKKCTLEYSVNWGDKIYAIKLEYGHPLSQIEFVSDLFTLIFVALYKDDVDNTIKIIEKHPEL